ncbi:hypothetical protein N2601_32360 (plasmid) [Rhizobium sp. CB3060]|uniref:hypothetical protein n=1 Tax=Rhizobium sp. CB3060 TaxID=3138255 RepID=UPI0021A5293D|nr:hypothetical protein [Rhizobium tropici]UWU26022.1 hypothetical protein N2601_32360 [Rhizobium tropici]
MNKEINTRQAFDLFAVARIENNKRLRDLVRRFHSAHSVELDLRSVQASLGSIDRLDREGMDDDSSHMAAALLMNAIVIYCRATHNEGKGRSKFDFQKAFDARQRGLQKELIGLRNEAFAHFGSDTADWTYEAPIYMMTERGNAVTVVHRRTNYRRKTIDDLSELTRVALPFAQKAQVERAEELHAQLREIRLCDSTFDRARFHPDDFLKDTPELIEEFWIGANFENTIRNE